jgi:DNA-binding MarR family transcriptional regulator
MSIFNELGLKNGEDRINEEIAYNIAYSYSLIDSYFNKVLEGYNLSPAKFNILMVVKHIGKDTGLAQQDISKRLFVTTSNMTHMVDKLEKSGYVERLSMKGDRRVNMIRITKNGSKLLDSVWPHYKGKINGLIGPKLAKNEKVQLNNLLEKLKVELKQAQI